MGSSATSFSISLSSLMCEEEGLFEDQQEIYNNNNSLIIDSFDNPFFVLEDEDGYIEYLFKQEHGFESMTHLLLRDEDDDDSSKIRYWLINARLHAIDWIFNTQEKFGFRVETAYLSVTYFDRFLSKRSIDESKPWAIQLLSVACLSVAAKMEEQKVPPLYEYPIEGYRFENKVIKNMELLILSTLEWKMGSATPFAYLHYFFRKFCPGSTPQTIITKATQHIVTLLRDVNLMHQRPSIIASAAILAAFDSNLTKKAMDLRMRVISSWGNVESGNVFSCYNLLQEKKIDKDKKTPCSDLLSAQSNSTCVVDNTSNAILGAKRKLDYEDSENCLGQKLHRP